MDKSEIAQLQSYMRTKFSNKALEIRPRPRKDDSAEVFLGDEFIGVMYRDEDEGELSYNFTMAIQEIDLEGH